MYYAYNPATNESLHFSSSIWAAKIIQALIETALDLWITRNKQLHGITPEEERRIQRDRTINIAKIKYAEGFKHVQARFPTLYRESCVTLCDRSILQLLKWIETYEICRSKLNRENTALRRSLLKAINIEFREQAVAGHV